MLYYKITNFRLTICSRTSLQPFLTSLQKDISLAFIWARLSPTASPNLIYSLQTSLMVLFTPCTLPHDIILFLQTPLIVLFTSCLLPHGVIHILQTPLMVLFTPCRLPSWSYSLPADSHMVLFLPCKLP